MTRRFVTSVLLISLFENEDDDEYEDDDPHADTPLRRFADTFLPQQPHNLPAFPSAISGLGLELLD